MHEKLAPYLNQAMRALGQDSKVLKRLADARSVYEKLTGKIDEDHQEYGQRMLNFNEWFLFDFEDKERQTPFITEFLNGLMANAQQGQRDEIELAKKLFVRVRYSFFEIRKKLFRNSLIIEDFLSGKKNDILSQNFPLYLATGEIFTGRTVQVDNNFFFFEGIRWLPTPLKGPAVAKAKEIRALGNPSEEKKFILNLEMIATKCIHFKHIDPVNIFYNTLKNAQRLNEANAQPLLAV